jgi:hypothetical protein
MIRISIPVISIRRLKTFCVSMFVLLFSGFAFGQGGVTTGDRHITVTDPKGGLEPHATLRSAMLKRV